MCLWEEKKACGLVDGYERQEMYMKEGLHGGRDLYLSQVPYTCQDPFVSQDPLLSMTSTVEPSDEIVFF